jgi:CubicO group peptidase (beta-lactamase class C family)
MSNRILQTTLQKGIANGLHVGAQAFIAHGDESAVDVAVGDARPGVPVRSDTLMIWMSACKPVTAVAIGQLWERGLLDPDDPVARHIPEFAQNGKDAVTIRQLLTHTAGFRGIAGDWERRPWDQIIAAVCEARLEPGWVPGEKAGYHVATSWYVLAEIVRRLDGRDFSRYVREAIFEPIGMHDSWIGLPPDRYRAYGERIGILHDTSGPVPDAEHFWDSEQGAAMCRPAGNGRGPVRELGRFYQMLRNKGEWQGVRVLQPHTVQALTSPSRVGMYDHTFRHVMDWGLGFMIQSIRYGRDTVPYNFGPFASDATFGHSGHQSSTAFYDAGNDLIVALVCNGMPGEARHHVRMREILEAIYQDLKLVEV